MVFRSNNNANPNGGVAYANCGNDSSYASANNGSRLGNNLEEIWTLVPEEINRRTIKEYELLIIEPRGMSHSNSSRKTGKLEHISSGRVW